MSAVGYCTRRAMGHRFVAGSLICTNCGATRTVAEAADAADARDASEAKP